MIFGNINDVKQNELLSTNKEFKLALDYLKKNDFSEARKGKVTLSENTYLFCNKLNTRELDLSLFEAHKNYLDIHFCISGKEEMYYAGTKDLEILQDYDEEKDVMFGVLKDYQKLTLNVGDYCIVYPEDVHNPSCGDGKELEKIVVKIKL